MIKIHDYKPNSPEWIMANFFDCWKKKRWKQILNYVQQSWVGHYDNIASKMIRLTLNNKLINAEFVQMNANTGVVAVFLMNIHAGTAPLIGKSLRAVRLVREGRRWGIDPKSIM